MACTLSKLAKHGYAVKLTENIAKRYDNTAIFLDKLFKTKRMFVNMLLKVKVAKDPEIFFFYCFLCLAFYDEQKPGGGGGGGDVVERLIENT